MPPNLPDRPFPVPLRHGGGDRPYLAHEPAALADRAPLVVQPHGRGIDPSRVHAVGVSNGAAMAGPLGWGRAGRLAAIEQVAGIAPADVAAMARPSVPLPVLEIHGTRDRSAPYEGGSATALWARLFLRRLAGPSLGVDEWVAMRIARNGTAAAPGRLQPRRAGLLHRRHAGPAPAASAPGSAAAPALRSRAMPDPVVSPAAPRPAPRTATIVNLGCKVNQAEMEAAARLLREGGVPLVGPDRGADLVIVNTCTVTSVADEKSRQAVRRARRANPAAQVVVTGCSVQVDPAAFARADPRATLVGNDAKAAFLAELEGLLALGRPDAGHAAPHEPLAVALPTLSGVEAAIPIDGIADDRASVERTRAFVKVQDGCSFHCTYCIIPRARGPERSLAPDEVLADVRRALAAGHREIVLTGINIGTYDGGWSERGARGSHARSALTLAGLVRRLLAETDVERIRLSSIEIQHLDDDLLTVWAEGGPRTLPHLHLPLQSGDDGVLRRMGRRYTADEYARTVRRARATLPGVAIHADVIVGFPTEDDAAFGQSEAFIRSLDLAGLHVFRYSARPGTPATRMAGQVDEAAKKARAAELLALAADARAAFARRGLGSATRVLVEQHLPGGRWVGHAEDHVLVAVAPRPGDPADLENAIVTVRRTAIDPEAPERAVGDIVAVDPAPPRRPGR